MSIEKEKEIKFLSKKTKTKKKESNGFSRLSKKKHK